MYENKFVFQSKQKITEKIGNWSLCIKFFAICILIKIFKESPERIYRKGVKKRLSLIFSLKLHQYMMSGSFLKFNCNVKCEIISISLFFKTTHYIKIYWSYFCFELIFACDCVTSFIICFMELCISSKY